ncbi:hypothetical protein [Tateyamaria sp. SN3-11]|uniref:hypothetical protein n=1 Tax=Tateyamaria sp. SN3-11 TaxID=3092147 RepID=UPI0039EB2F57
MNAVSLLSEIIEQVGKVGARAYRNDAQFGALLDAGLLQCDGMVQSVVCANCDESHDAEIIFEGGSYGHYCPDLGFVTIERADLVSMRPNLVGLVEQLHVAFGCELGSTSQLGPHTWRIGLVETPGGRAVAYFHPRLLNSDDLDDLNTALRAEIRRDYSLVVTAAGLLPYRDAATRNLAQLVQLDLRVSRLRKDVTVAEAVGAPNKPTGGRPSLHREHLHELLAERATQGSAEKGRNAEAEAVRAAYIARFPNVQPPRLSTVKAYVLKFRRG